MHQRRLIAVSPVLLALLLGLSMFFNEPTDIQETFIDCPIAQQSCSFDTAFGEASLTLTPQPPSSKSGINVEFNLSGDAPQRVWIDLQGKTMYMGINQRDLQPTEGVWKAPASLGVCTTGMMRWVLRLILEQHQRQQIYRFEFDAH